MMKFILLILFMNLMIFNNKFQMFYYNLINLFMLTLIFVYMFKDDFVWVCLSAGFGVSYYSYWLIMLSFWIISLVMMHSNLDKMKFLMFLILLMVLVSLFMCLDLLMFYLIFEVSLIPIFFLIIYWGHNVERVSAAYYLMMYMLVISFPLLLYVFKMFFYSNTLKFSLMEFYMENYEVYLWEVFIIYGAFLVKMPMYVVHIWLPKAHVEASVEGSMILAGVLLKMGGYGLIRLILILFKYTFSLNYLFMGIGLVGSIFVSVMCINQIDMKMLVAYSSVVHMNMMLISMMTFYKLGVLSSLIIMIAHGMCSSGLFYMVNLCYRLSGSRLLILNKGIIGGFGYMTLGWFLLCSSNFSFPLSLNFFGEILMLGVILNWDFMFMLSIVFVCFFCSVYSLNLYIYLQHGENNWMINKNMMGFVKEFVLIGMHYCPLGFLLMNLIMYM